MNMENHPEKKSALEEHQEPLIDVLENLEAQIEKQNSLRTTFIKGAIYGLGTVIGATLLVAIFGGLIANTIGLFTDEPLFTNPPSVGR